MTSKDRRLTLILAPFALVAGLWVGQQLEPDSNSLGLVLLWLMVFTVALLLVLVAKRKGWW